MNDVSKLPKWAQNLIADLQKDQRVTGADISNCSVEMIGFKSDAESAQAITAVANALSENAKSLGKLAETIVPKNVNTHFDSAISVREVKGK